MKLSKQKLAYLFSSRYLLLKALAFITALFMISCSGRSKPAEQRSYLTPDILCGTVQFSDGCSPQLDTLIRFGIALIHHMTYDDAEHTFENIIKKDPDCFWGYWGKAMTYVHPLWPDIPDQKTLSDGYILTQTALKLAKNTKEKLYGAAIAAYYKDGLEKTEPERLIAFRDGWQNASRQLQDDIEAKMFSVLSSLATVSPDDKSYRIQMEAGAAAEKVLETIPDHPGAFHYAIHAYDYPPLADKALRLAENYYKIAPELPHALHMPSHIFTRLGYWQKSIDLNLRSAKAAKKMPVNGQVSAQYFHALDYLEYAYLQQSEFGKAKEIAVLLDSLRGSFETSPTTAYALAAIPARAALEYQNWGEAAGLKLNRHTGFPWNKFPQYEALIYYANGIGAGRSGNEEIARQSFSKLEAIQNSYNKSEANQYWITQLEIQKTAVKAWLLFSQGERNEALREMKRAAELEDATEKLPVTPGQLLPAREMLGDLLTELKRPDEALKQYKLSLQNNPNRFNSLFGAGNAAELAGKKKEAEGYFTALIKGSKASDGKQRPRLEFAAGEINHK